MNTKTTRLFQKTAATITLTFILALSFFSATAFSAETPTYDPNWRLTINGTVNKPLTLSINDLAAMPTTTVSAPLLCYGVLLTSGDWTGVTLGQLLSAAQINPQGNTFSFSASDGYNIIITATDHPQWASTIIAYQKDGQPLTESLRLILPNENGAQWISMITSLTVSIVAPPEDTTPPSGGGSGPAPSSPSTLPTPTQAPADQQENQTSTPSTVPSTDNQTQSGVSSVNSHPIYLVLPAVLITLVIASVACFIFWKVRKIHK
jgi:DMSO/TMAO reductase YedYZ molybdopterin-dependent catalytic subunit